VSRGAADTHDLAIHRVAPRSFIAIGIPSFGMVHLYWVTRLMNLRMPMNTVIRWFYVVGKEVGEARNEIVAKALASDDTSDPPMRCASVFFIDDDVLFHPDALLQLASHQRPIVSGLYYSKTSVPTPLALHDEGDGTARTWTPGDLLEVAGHGMGLTLIDADVFRAVRDRGALGVDAHGYPAWFKTTRDAGLLRPDGEQVTFNQTEDMHFLSRARALGYQPAVDTAPQAFAWHLDAKRSRVFPEKQWAEWSTRGTITWETATAP
jgi:hypothetical protein